MNLRSNFCPIIEVNQDAPSRNVILKAVDILLAGGIIIYPTDTLYGFGVLINNQQAVDKFYAIKKRDPEKPFSVLINHIDQVENICGPLDDKEKAICNALWPGKVTLLLKVNITPKFPVLSGLNKIGFRHPQSKLCEELINFSGIPISSSSVNISNGPDMLNVDEITKAFASQVDLILDDGPARSTKGSTVLDISSSSVTIVRQGEVSKNELENTLKFKIHSGNEKKYIITFICSGNICRSPMAEGILKDRLQKSKFIDLVGINSAGTLDLPPEEASRNAIEIAKEHGIDISNHSSRVITDSIVEQANLIICMAENHYHYLIQHYPQQKNKVYILKLMDKKGGYSEASIADPIGKDREFYSKTYDDIAGEIDRILPYLYEQITHSISSE